MENGEVMLWYLNAEKSEKTIQTKMKSSRNSVQARLSTRECWTDGNGMTIKDGMKWQQCLIDTEVEEEQRRSPGVRTR